MGSAPVREVTPKASELLVQSHFLIMQSKRLLLISTERRAALRDSERMRERLQRLRSESDMATASYRRIVLGLGSPAHPDYWPVAYSQMIQLGDRLSARLRETADTMPASDASQIAVDLQLLEQLVNGWTDSMRARIAAA